MSYITFDTPLGPMIASVRMDDRLACLTFMDDAYGQKILSQDCPLANGQQSSTLARTKKFVDNYFSGQPSPWDAVLSFPKISPFRDAVWDALRHIPFGHRTSYQSIADTIHRSNAVRAVGTAIGANPFCLLIPCHRIIHTNGAIGDYRGGADRKKWLLSHERTYL